MSDEHIYKSYNKTLLLYHLVFPAKYRRKVFAEEVSERLKEICKEIENCYEIHFVEIGMEEDHVHFLVQSVPTLAVSKIVMTVKSITAKEIFKSFPQIKREILWGGRSIMDERILCEHSRIICKQRYNNAVYTKSGKR